MVNGIHVVHPIVVGIVIRAFLTRYNILTCAPDLWITKINISGSIILFPIQHLHMVPLQCGVGHQDHMNRI